MVESAMAMLAARAGVDVEFGRRRICLARGHLLVGLLRLVAVFAQHRDMCLGRQFGHVRDDLAQYRFKVRFSALWSALPTR